MKGQQGQTPVQLEDDPWTEFADCPSFGGKSGERMSSMARYNSQRGLMDVRFFSGPKNTYRSTGITARTWEDFTAGRLGANSTATYAFLVGKGGFKVG